MEKKKLERVQRVSLSLIYGRNLTYEKLLTLSKLDILKTGRERLSINFARKAIKHPKFKCWFKQTNPGQPGQRVHYTVSLGRQRKILKSPIPYLTNLLNRYNGY